LDSEKRRSWKPLTVVICVLGLIGVWLAFGERGLTRLYRTGIERQVYEKRIHELTLENRALMEEVKRLRTDMEYLESVARKELGLIKPGETVYRFKKGESPDKGVSETHTGAAKTDGKKKSEKERHHDR
jgi:cell division protein FtsB